MKDERKGTPKQPVFRAKKEVKPGKSEPIMKDYLSPTTFKKGPQLGKWLMKHKKHKVKRSYLKTLNALKEARETKYWIELLKETDYVTDKEAYSIREDIIGPNKKYNQPIK